MLEAIAGEIEIIFIAFAAMRSHGVDPTMARLPQAILGLGRDEQQQELVKEYGRTT